MSKSAKKRPPPPAHTETTAAKPSPLAIANPPRPHKADPGTKQSRVIAMLQSPASLWGLLEQPLSLLFPAALHRACLWTLSRKAVRLGVLSSLCAMENGSLTGCSFSRARRAFPVE
jgi:hypothetical protein